MIVLLNKVYEVIQLLSLTVEGFKTRLFIRLEHVYSKVTNIQKTIVVVFLNHEAN